MNDDFTEAEKNGFYKAIYSRRDVRSHFISKPIPDETLTKILHAAITIQGHADERGTREYNLALGERRASAVRDYLQSMGVASSQLRIVSYGEERPVDPRSTESAWSKNRRVELAY